MGWGEGSRDNFISGSTSCYDNRNLFISDKKAACYSLGGYLKYEGRDTLLECEIECCNSSRCNTQNLSLTQDAVTVFTPEGIIVNIFKLYTYFTEPELCEFTVDVCHAWTTPLGLHQPSAEKRISDGHVFAFSLLRRRSYGFVTFPAHERLQERRDES